MKKIRLAAVQALLGLVLLGTSSFASADIIRFSLDGIVDAADAGNAFGLSAGDMIRAHGTFDTDSVEEDGDLSFVAFGLGTGNRLFANLGDILLRDKNDVDFLDGFFPVLFFDGATGEFGVNFITEIGVNGAPANFSSLVFFFGADGEGLGFEGQWLSDSFRVPEPGTLALLGIGLTLVGFSRRRRKV